jgi:hypothetical protein
MTDAVKYTSLSQTFRVTAPPGVPGVYVSKLGLFFRKKSDSLGVQAFLMQVTNNLPDPDKVIPNSLVTVDVEDVATSTDGSSETQFVFPQLVYLNAGETYAFGIKSIGSSPDYEVWVGELGQRDLATDKPIGSNPVVETAYFAGNKQKYADLINQDIKFNLYRAKFTATSGTAALRNNNTEIISFYNLSSVSGAVDIRAGDHVYAWSNSYVNTAANAVVTKLDMVNSLLYVKNSSGNFTSNTDIVFVRTGEEGDPTSNNSGMLGIARIDSTANNGITKFAYHGIVPKLAINKIPFTGITLRYKGAKYNGTKYVQDDEKLIDNNIELEFRDRTRYWLGETDERDAGNEFRTGVTPSGKPCTNSSIIIEASMNSDNDFISPAIDLTRNNVILLRNIINANTTDEHTVSGGAASRYISKIITLEDEQEAEDLRIFITANKPANTEIHVYSKIWSDSDPEPFDSKVWSKMTYENPATVRNTNAPDEFLEYVYSFANSATLAGNALAAFQANNTVPVSYLGANSTGGVTGGPSYGGSGYSKVIKKFAVKLVLTSDTGLEYIYPTVNDLRVIALQM